MKSHDLHLLLFLCYGVWKVSAENGNSTTCNLPVPPTNGEVKRHKKDSTIAIYTCNAGYGLIGESHRNCEGDGEWSGNIPSCKLQEEKSSASLDVVLPIAILIPIVAGVIFFLWKKKHTGKDSVNGTPYNLTCYCCDRNDNIQVMSNGPVHGEEFYTRRELRHQRSNRSTAKGQGWYKIRKEDAT